MTLNIISAEKIEFSGEVDFVQLPGINGLFSVLNHHASLISVLTAGTIQYENLGKRESMEINGGIADIDNNIISVCLY